MLNYKITQDVIIFNSNRRIKPEVEVCTTKDVKFILAESIEGQDFTSQMVRNKGAEP